MSSKNMLTSVIGSYPVSINTFLMMQSYFDQQPISWDPWISSAVSDMLAAGIDVVSDGQTRDPFIQLFTRKLYGCRIRARPEIIDTIQYTQPITVADQQRVRQVVPVDKKLVGVLTGPFTLAKSCVDLFYHDEQAVAFDFAKALHKEAVALEQIVDVLSIDEPYFATHYPEYAHELLETITQHIRCPIRLHVCGNIESIVANIVELPVDILSHEFKASPQLFTAFSEYPSKHQICLGCVRSDSVSVESVEEIKNHIQQAFSVFDDRIIQLAPDCGQRLLPRDAAFQKLCNLVRAGEQRYD